jgi:NAD(P)-dependent dehydrogenase (short-subunit alcohol dehydrogenase family)
VNVAGAMIYRPVADCTADDWRRLLDVNFVGAALYTGHALSRMRPGGCVVNVASVHARRTTALVAPYAAAKAALVSLTRSAAIEGRALGIRVNAVLPGAIDTAMLRDSPAIRSGAELLDERDVGHPADVAAVVAFLASDAAGFITGEDVVADAGRMGRL